MSTERRYIHPAWSEDTLGAFHQRQRVRGKKGGRPPTMVGYSRAGVAAEAGVLVTSLSETIRLGRVDERSPYQVVGYIANRKRKRLRREFGVDVENLQRALLVLEALSLERQGKPELARELARQVGAGDLDEEDDDDEDDEDDDVQL